MKVLDMMTSEDIKRIKEDREELDLTKRVKELDNSLSIALEINDNYQRDNKKLKKRAEEAEGENTIIKGIGQNSPEMKDKQKRIEYLEGKCREAGRAMIELNMKYEANIKKVGELKSDLARAKEDHQYDNLVHQKELESLRKK